MFRSPGLRFIAVGVLALLMFIPLNLVSGIVEDRAGYSRGTIESVSRDWGGPQLFSGPLVVIPVTEEVTYDRRREAVDAVSALTLRDDKGNPVFEQFKETVTETRAPVYLYPDRLDIAVDVTTTRRHRGIFEVPVYTAAMQMQFHYDAAPVAATLGEKEEIHWQDAALRVFLGSNHALRGEAEMGDRPLEKARWGGAVDNVGGKVLGWLTRSTVPFGNITSIGLAGGVELNTTVMPFILRGVSLLGINSVLVPHALRMKVWSRLAGDLKPRHLDAIVTREVTMDELPGVFDEYIEGSVTGRTVVKIES